MIIDKTKEEAGKCYQILSAKNNLSNDKNLSLSPRSAFKKIVLIISSIIFWVIFVWMFLKSFYYGY